jgi:hypothetical protein
LQDSKKWITNSADAKLVGHEKDALFPLATCNAAPLVASGGTDKLLLLWDLRDVEDGLLAKREKDDGRATTELQSRCGLDSKVVRYRHTMMLSADRHTVQASVMSVAVAL